MTGRGGGLTEMATSIYDTDVSAEVTGSVFEDDAGSTGTACLCHALGSGGTLTVQRLMGSSGQWVDISSEAVTASTPLFLVYDAPLVETRAKFNPTTTASLIEVEFWSRGGRE